LVYCYRTSPWFIVLGTHLGLERTAENITAQYHWNGIYKFIKQYIRQCQVCLERHPKLLGKSKSKTEEDSDASMGEDTDSGAEDKEDTSCSAQSVVRSSYTLAHHKFVQCLCNFKLLLSLIQNGNY
jgi:hypothetical protein